MQECSEMNHLFCIRIFSAVTNTLATSWDMPAPVSVKRLEKMIFETLDSLPLFPGRRHPDFPDTIAFGDFTTDCRFLSCLAEIGLEVLITDLTMPGDGCARSDRVVRAWNASSFVDSIDGLFIVDVGTFGEDGEGRPVPVVFVRATLVVVVGRAPSSSLFVRSTSCMLLFKLLVILWYEKKH